MKISCIDIYGYGKWVNQRFDLDRQLQLIYGQNEAGKSTIQSFIRSVLFGFPSKHRRVNQINRYEPKMGEVYGGRLLLEATKFGDVWVERTNKGLSLMTVQGEELPENLLGQLLGGLDEKLFDYFYAFSLQNLQELSNVDADKLSDYFLSIGTIGSDKFLSVAKQFEKEADSLYRRSGKKPELNQLLLEYEELQNSLDNMQAQQNTYDQLFQSRQEELIEIERMDQEIKLAEEELRQLDQLMGRFDTYQKDLAAQKELDRLVFTKMDPQFPEQLDNAFKSKQASEKTIQQMEERIRHLTSEMNALTRLTWGLNHENERRQWNSDTQRIKQVEMRLKTVTDRIQEQNQTLARLAREGQFYPEKVTLTQQFDQQIERGFEIQAEIDDLKGQKESLQTQRKVYLDQRRELQQYSLTAKQQYAKLESLRINEKAQLDQLTHYHHYFPGLLSLLIGILLGSYHFLIQSAMTFRWIAFILIGIGLLALVYTYSLHRKYRKQFEHSTVLSKMAELKNKEKQYHERSQTLGQDINQREANLRQIEEELVRKNQLQQRWLVGLGFYPTANPERILQVNPVKEYLQAETIKQQYEVERNDLTLELSNWKKSIEKLLERFPIADQALNVLIHHVEETEVSIARQIERGKAMQERMQNASEIIEQEKQSISVQTQQIEAIFQATNSFDEIDFRRKVQTNQQIEMLKAKREIYAEQIDQFEEELASIESKQALVTSYNQVQNKLNLFKTRLQPHLYQRANLEVKLNQLEQDGGYSLLQQQIENKKAEILSLISEWAKKKLAVELIYRTLRQGMDNPIPQMNEMANEIFNKLTYGRYDQIKLNKNSIKVKQFSDILFSPHELSQGTLEQLYVALRLAFIMNASNMVSMPIIIDDAFVNFDEVRKASMYEVLESISEKNQVLFFTFDQQAVETLSMHRVINLDEYENEMKEEE